MINERIACVRTLPAFGGSRQCSSIFDFTATGDPPDRYSLMFRGKGIARDASPRSDVEFVQLHEIDLRLPYSYPSLPPDLRWVTPILHPNVSFSGFIHLRDVGLPWDDSVTLDAVCERLWDVARLAYMNLDRATNFSAKNWVEKPNRLTLPVDARILRQQNASGRGQRHPLPAARHGASPGHRRLAETCCTSAKIRRSRHCRDTVRPRPPARGDDDDILYIGDD